MIELSTNEDWRELAIRDGDGLEISLLWSKSADRVKVSVADQRLGESFDIQVARADALGAFYHPFAHAGRGSTVQAVSRAATAELKGAST